MPAGTGLQRGGGAAAGGRIGRGGGDEKKEEEGEEEEGPTHGLEAVTSGHEVGAGPAARKKINLTVPRI